MKISCIVVSRRTRPTRLDSQPKAGTTPSSSTACPADAYALSSAPPPPSRISGSRTTLST
jgi:hypothetical protein